MSKSVYHVTPNDDRWAVKKEGNERASSMHDTQAEAIESARELAHQHDDIVIHRPDGTIRERITYSGTSNSESNGGSQGGSTNQTERVGSGRCCLRWHASKLERHHRRSGRLIDGLHCLELSGVGSHGYHSR